MASNNNRKNVTRISEASLVFKKRASKSDYVADGYTAECDLMLEIEVEGGKRYRIPAFRP